MIGPPPRAEPVRQGRQHILCRQLPFNDNGPVLPGELVEHGEPAKRFSIVRVIGEEIVRRYVVPVLRPEPDAGPVVEPQPPPLRLAPRHLQPLLPPDSLHPLRVPRHAVLRQASRDPAGAVPAILGRERGNRGRPRGRIGPGHRLLALRRAVLSEDATRPPFGDPLPLAHRRDTPAPARGAQQCPWAAS